MIARLKKKMNTPAQQREIDEAYKRYYRFYDFVFGKVFEEGRNKAIECLSHKPGYQLLEAGVGTGLSLPLYPKDYQVTGIDTSPHMLEIAEKRCEKQGLENVTLKNMDSSKLDFPDNSFDGVVSMYLVSVVPDPVALMDEIYRVCKPGGDIVIVNHFSRQGHPAYRFEKALSKLDWLVGFQSFFPLDDFLEKTNLRVAEEMPVNPLGYWTLLHSKNDK